MPVHQDSILHDIVNVFFATPSDKIGAFVSAGMIASPIWLQAIHPVSDIAAVLAPILGCIYLSLQIGFKLWDRTRNDE